MRRAPAPVPPPPIPPPAQFPGLPPRAPPPPHPHPHNPSLPHLNPNPHPTPNPRMGPGPPRAGSSSPTQIITLHNFIVHHRIKNEERTYVFNVPSYFEITGIRGQGAYGIVVSALDHRPHSSGHPPIPIAIKKIVNLFEQNKIYQSRILREVMIMKHFSVRSKLGASQHCNILPLLDIVAPVNMSLFRDVYLVTPLLDYDLCKITSAPKMATERMVKYILHQILDGVAFLHSVNVVHRDLKPSNILISRALDVKICDFGLSRGIDEGCDASCTYVSTRWYRAPELCLAWQKCSFACDVWSIGCLFAELMAAPPNKVLFTGTNYLDQLRRIFMVVGKPSAQDMRGCPDGINWVRTNIPDDIRCTNLERIFAHCSPLAVDLLKRMLVLDPLRRIKAFEALEHPFFADFQPKVMPLPPQRGRGQGLHPQGGPGRGMWMGRGRGGGPGPAMLMGRGGRGGMLPVRPPPPPPGGVGPPAVFPDDGGGYDDSPLLDSPGYTPMALADDGIAMYGYEEDYDDPLLDDEMFDEDGGVGVGGEMMDPFDPEYPGGLARRQKFMFRFDRCSPNMNLKQALWNEISEWVQEVKGFRGVVRYDPTPRHLYFEGMDGK